MALSGISRLGPVPLRLAAGACLASQGYHALFEADMDRLVGAVARLDLPQPELLASLAAWGALAGGVLLVIGFATRLAALWNAATAGVILWKVDLGSDPLAGLRTLLPPQGTALSLLLLSSCLALVLLGAGALSVDALLAPRDGRDAHAA